MPTIAPLRCAAFNALLPLIVVSLVATPGPRALLPILVTFSQSSLIVSSCREGWGWDSSAGDVLERLQEDWVRLMRCQLGKGML